MVYREVPRMEIKQVIRRWQAGVGPGQIVLGTGLSSNTVRKYLVAAQAEGVARDGPLPRRGAAEPASGDGADGAEAGGDAPTGPGWSRGPTRSTSGSPATGCR